jgi:hypothetical protein
MDNTGVENGTPEIADSTLEGLLTVPPAVLDGPHTDWLNAYVTIRAYNHAVHQRILNAGA